MRFLVNPFNDLSSFDIQVKASGNMAILLGCNSIYNASASGNTISNITFSDDNAFKISYIKLRSPCINGGFQKVSPYVLDSDTIAVLTMSD